MLKLFFLLYSLAYWGILHRVRLFYLSISTELYEEGRWADNP